MKIEEHTQKKNIRVSPRNSKFHIPGFKKFGGHRLEFQLGHLGELFVDVSKNCVIDVPGLVEVIHLVRPDIFSAPLVGFMQFLDKRLVKLLFALLKSI